MKVLFLDIDGVLNSLNFSSQRREISPIQNILDPSFENAIKAIDPKTVERLSRIIARTGASIVLSSTWRMKGNSPEFVLRMLEKIFLTMGFDIKFIGYTPINLTPIGSSGLLRAQERGDEITEWLRQNPQVTHVAILDDDRDMGNLKPWLIQTDWEWGLTEDNVEETIVLLDKPGPKI